MTKFVRDREEIVKKILLLNDQNLDNLAEAMNTWWVNIRSNGGLELTKTGDYEFLKAKLYYECFEFCKNYNYNSVFYLKLNKFFPCPYFLFTVTKKRYIRVYDSRITMLIHLHGNIHEYINSLN